MSEGEHIREARRWLQYADEDMQIAETLLTQTLVFRHICWLAQQSAEKMFKAALLALQIDFPRWHDLDVLRNLLPQGWKVKSEFPDLSTLTEWAVESRYPGDWPEATEADAKIALEQTKHIRRVIWGDFQQHLSILTRPAD